MTEQLDGNVRLGDIMKNFLAEEILAERTRVAMKSRFGFGRAVEMLPSLGRHSLAHNLAQIAQAHLLERFFGHSMSVRRSNFPAIGAGISETERREAVTFFERQELAHAQLLGALAELPISVFDRRLGIQRQSVTEIR